MFGGCGPSVARLTAGQREVAGLTVNQVFTKLPPVRSAPTRPGGYMFDSFLIDCDQRTVELQTKRFDSVLEPYRLGDVVAGASARAVQPPDPLDEFHL